MINAQSTDSATSKTAMIQIVYLGFVATSRPHENISDAVPSMFDVVRLHRDCLNERLALVYSQTTSISVDEGNECREGSLLSLETSKVF